VGKILIVTGLTLAALGVLVHWGVPLGRLPGDLVVRRGTTTVYVPIVTSIALSLLLTVLFSLFRR